MSRIQIVDCRQGNNRREVRTLYAITADGVVYCCNGYFKPSSILFAIAAVMHRGSIDPRSWTLVGTRTPNVNVPEQLTLDLTEAA